jgi:hypothetical protein
MRAHKASRIPGLGCRAVARCAIVCCSCSLNRMNPRVSPRVSVRVVSLIIPSMTATQSPHQLSAWFGLSSCSSMCALQHTALTSQMPALGCRAVARRAIVCCHCSFTSQMPGLGCRAVVRRAIVLPLHPHQSNAWVGLSSCCSTCYRVLPLLPHLRVRMNHRVSPRASARGVPLNTPSMTAAHSPNQSNAWVGLSSSCSTCDCVLPLLPHLRAWTNH